MRFRITILDVDMGFTRLIDNEDAQRENRWPYGLDFSAHRAYFCPGCGKVWAKWEREDSPFLHWHSINATCPDHQLGAYSGDNPGCLIKYPNDIIVLPTKALEREVMQTWRE